MTRRFRCVLLALMLAVVGCSVDTKHTYQVSQASDRFSHTIDGQTVSYANWQIAVRGKVIDIPHVASTVEVQHKRGRIKIDVNGKTVYTD